MIHSKPPDPELTRGLGLDDSGGKDVVPRCGRLFDRAVRADCRHLLLLFGKLVLRPGSVAVRVHVFVCHVIITVYYVFVIWLTNLPSFILM